MALLEGVEACFLKDVGRPFKKVWRRGKGYKLELHSNVTGHFLLSSFAL